VAEAQAKGVFLRILGSTGFRIHSPQYVAIHTAMNRPMTDIDFAAYSRQDREIESFFVKQGFEPLKAALTPELFAHRRIYNHPSGLHVDIFLDELAMCHRISFKDRLEVDSPTIPLAELVLEKTQIVKMAEKDIKDMLILLAAHEIGGDDRDKINGRYISDLLSKDWGFYYTNQLSLAKIRRGMQLYQDLFSPDDQKTILSRLDELERQIEAAPKSLKWKARAAVGTKVKWYNDVDEVERAEHLQDID
jgi:hypothetical protein